METPVANFLKEYSEKDVLRLHMPGHKGKYHSNDITEVNGADVLYHAEGIIKQSQENAAELFGSEKTVYSTEGSSLVIRAMLYLVKLYADKKGLNPVIMAGRNAHKSFLTAAALMDLNIKWLYPQNWSGIISNEITASNLEKELMVLKQKGTLPVAVYITTPDYLGNILDVKSISSVCKKYKTLLIADNAHGSYLKFLPEDIHPISLGADMCCDSAHKTLPVLTGGAYFHISQNAPRFFCEYAENAMSVFASTSPSYLMLQSLDKANKYLAEDYRNKLAYFIQKIRILKKRIEQIGISVVGEEPLKITLQPKKFGYTGVELAEIFHKKNIVCEFFDPDYLVMMLSPENGEEVFIRIESVLTALVRRESIEKNAPVMTVPEIRMSPRRAIMSAGKKLNINECAGKILASVAVSCPPAIPIVVCGEVISQDAIELFKYYGIEECFVID